jgi:hypothetical protein
MNRAQRRARAKLMKQFGPVLPDIRENSIRLLSQTIEPEALREVLTLLVADRKNWTRRFPPKRTAAARFSEILIECNDGFMRIGCKPAIAPTYYT